MTKAEQLLELAARCEAATGPDRELDREIIRALGLFVGTASGEGDDLFLVSGHPNLMAPIFGVENARRGNPVPRFTASLDAAMTLVPKWIIEQRRRVFLLGEWPEWGCHLDDLSGGSDEWAWPRFKGRAATLPLAICAAALRARATLAQEDEQ